MAGRAVLRTALVALSSCLAILLFRRVIHGIAGTFRYETATNSVKPIIAGVENRFAAAGK
jgi:hypothetical protein